MGEGGIKEPFNVGEGGIKLYWNPSISEKCPD